MSERIRELLTEITRLEDELETELHERQSRVLFRIEGTRVRFEEQVRQAHLKLKVRLLPWLRRSSVASMVSAPLIYSLIVPFALLDLWLWLYQATCFPVYGLVKVKRESYIAIDRHQLGFLNSVERFNCVYCGYINGLIAYAREIASRTEQYWCPIKHARRIVGAHRRYTGFLEFGDADDYQERLQRYRQTLQEERG